MMQPSLFDSGMGHGKIHKGLLVVPVNTITNWENEFDKWTKGMIRKIQIFNVSRADKHSRRMVIEQWSSFGGILLTSVGLFRTMAERKDTEKHILATDVIVLDER
jgi:SNF2 family DNA or RNA helicase